MAYKYKRKKGTKLSKSKKPDRKFKGVKYKSGLEYKMAVLLDAAKIPFNYEPVTYVLQEKFMFENECYERQVNGKGEFKNRGQKSIRQITYTPDFVGEGFIIETKGYANESFRNKWKQFKYLIHSSNQDVILFKPQNHKECEKVIEIIKNKLYDNSTK